MHLLPGEHKQFDGLLEDLGVSGANLRVEAKVVSTTGRVTVYASRVDNRTGDPFVAHPVVPEAGRKWVVPGAADLDTGQASWRTDLRIHNAGDEPVEATLRFYPQRNVQVTPPTAAAARPLVAGRNRTLSGAPGYWLLTTGYFTSTEPMSARPLDLSHRLCNDSPHRCPRLAF